MIAGFPMIDSRPTLIDGAYHDVDRSLDLRDRGAAPLSRGHPEGRAELLEPMMSVKAVTPEDIWATSSAI